MHRILGSVGFAFAVAVAAATPITMQRIRRDDSVSRPPTMVETIQGHLANFEWTVNIKVGSTGKNFTVLLDTGSGTLWIPGINCSSGFCSSKSLYDPMQSTTAVLSTNESLHLVYGSGSLNGSWVQDDVWLGGVKVQGMQFGVMNTGLDGVPVSVPFDGIMGLGLVPDSEIDHNVRPVDAPTFLKVAKEQNVIGSNMFTLSLWSLPTLKNPVVDGGELVLGGLSQHIHGEVSYTPVVSPIGWKVNADTFELGGHIVKSNILTWIDSGTNLLVLRSADLKHAFEDEFAQFGNLSLTSGFGYALSPCPTADIVATFPIITLTLGGRHFDLLPSNYVHPIDGSADCSLSVDTDSDPHGTNSILLGARPFMEKFSIVFDTENKRVGFAENHLSKA